MIDLDSSTDLFVSPKPPSPPRKRPRNDQPQRTTTDRFRTSSAVGKSAVLCTVSSNDLVGKAPHGRNPVGKLAAGASASVSGKPAVGGILAKKVPFGVPVIFAAQSSSSSIFREGYNGLGGHDKCVVPPARSQQHRDVVKKLLIGPQKVSKKTVFGPSKTASTPPPLPSLGDSP